MLLGCRFGLCFWLVVWGGVCGSDWCLGDCVLLLMWVGGICLGC